MRYLFVVLLTASTAVAAEPKGPLAALPSQPGAHIEKIKALKDNEWLHLGVPSPDAKWGKARGSAWGAKALVYAPDLQGAFLFGEGVHAFVKPDGHGMDDLWFYDMNAHAWLCLYPGNNTRTFNQRVKDKELTIADNGLLVDQTGQPIPVHTLIHAWGYLTYDSDRRKFAFLAGNGLGRYYMPGLKQVDEGLTLLEKQLTDKKKLIFAPWYYDVATGRFERDRATGSLGSASQGFPQLHYLPASKRFIVAGPGGAAFFDVAKKEWTAPKQQGPSPKGYDRPGCYDSKRNRVYSHDADGVKAPGAGLMAYDIDTNTWIELKPKGKAPLPSNTNGAYFEYDADLDVVVALLFRGEAPGVYIYSPAENSWSGPAALPAEAKFSFAPNTCFNRELNAFFLHKAGDSTDNGTIWVYRYKNKKK